MLVLIPKMVSVMMEGLTAIGEAAKEFMKKHIGEGKNYISEWTLLLVLEIRQRSQRQ